MDGKVRRATHCTARPSVLVLLADCLMIWLERARDRRLLSRFDDRMLCDIGADRGVVDSEIRKPFWRR
jgi:uncharacterized protein YjiS (DUF1127 family)